MYHLPEEKTARVFEINDARPSYQQTCHALATRCDEIASGEEKQNLSCQNLPSDSCILHMQPSRLPTYAVITFQRLSTCKVITNRFLGLTSCRRRLAI